MKKFLLNAILTIICAAALFGLGAMYALAF